MMPSLRNYPLPATFLDVEASYATFDTESGFTQIHSGVKVWKNVDDMARYREVIEATKPDVIIETGTRWGGSAAWFADEFGVDVVTVDVERTDGRADEWPGVTFVLGDSKAPEVVDRVRRLVADKRVMVSLDSDHHAPHVVAEIGAYAPLISPGCYLVIEDGIGDLVDRKRARRIGRELPRTGGPLRAIAATIALDPRFTRDEAVENRSPITYYPAGWWVRMDGVSA